MNIIIIIVGGFVFYQLYRGYKQNFIQIFDEKSNNIKDKNLTDKYQILLVFRVILKVFIFISVIIGIYGVVYFTYESRSIESQVLIILYTCFSIFCLVCGIHIINFLFDLYKTKKDKD